MHTHISHLLSVPAAVFGFCLPVITAAGSGEALYMATSRKVPLYQGRRITEALNTGDIVRARPHSVQAVWLDLVWNGKRYSAMRRYFMSRAELSMAYGAQQATLQSKIDRITDKIRAAERRAMDQFAAAASIRVDAAVRYKVTALVPVVRNTTGDVSPAGRIQVTPKARAVYDYQDRIAFGRADRLAAKWENEMADLDRQIAQLERSRRGYAAKLARTIMLDQIAEARFEQVARIGNDDLNTLYITIDDRVRLFLDSRLRLELFQGTVVRAIPDRTFSGWLRLAWKGRKYAARTKHFRRWSRIELEHAEQSTLDAWSVADGERRIRVLQARRDLLDSLRINLRHRYNLKPPPFNTCPWPRGFSASGFYRVSDCPPQAVEFVDPARARRCIREWDKTIDDIDAAIRGLRNQIARRRKNRLAADALYREQIRRFSAVVRVNLPLFDPASLVDR